MSPESITRITFKPAGTEDAGTCTCSAKGIGTEDSDDVKLIGAGKFFLQICFVNVQYNVLVGKRLI